MTCDFIFNASFEESLVKYGDNYESTQSFSPNFNHFQKTFLEEIVREHRIYRQNILEIGCGQGEALKYICSISNSNGVGYDPAYRGPKHINMGNYKLTFEKDFLTSHHSVIADWVLCLMTLEHISNVKGWLETVLLESHETLYYFHVPNMDQIISGGNFWDIYYEHCSYFTQDYLSNLSKILNLQTLYCKSVYGGQYLAWSFRKGRKNHGIPANRLSGSPETIVDFQNQMSLWGRKIKRFVDSGKKIALWGGGSKAVAFINSLELENEIAFVVDVNPNKNQTFLPASGHIVRTPEYLKQEQVDVILLMNPIYSSEVSTFIKAELNYSIELIPVKKLLN